MKNVFWSLVNSFVTKGFGAIFSIILGNLILPGELGIYVTLMIITTISSQLFGLQIGKGVIQKINCSSHSERNLYFSSGLVSVFSLSILAIAILFLFHWNLIDLFDISRTNELFYFILPLVFLIIGKEYFMNILQAELRMKRIARINIAAAVIQILVTLILVKLGMKIKGIFVGLYCANGFAFVVMGYFAFRNFSLSFSDEIIKYGKSLIKFSSLIYIGSIAVILDKQIDLLFVSHFLPKEDVAIYNYAVKFSLLILVFGNSISRVTFPRLTQAFSSFSESKVNHIFSKSINYSFFILSVGVLFILFNIPYIIVLILPEFYLNMIPSLTILMTSLLLFAAWSSIGSIFTSKGIPRYSSLLNWTALIINIALNLWLIPTLGIIGAAISTSTSFLFRFLAGIVLVEIKIRTHFNYLNLFVSYFLFLGLVLLDYFVLESLIIKELIIIGYLFASYFILFGKEKNEIFREFLKKFNVKYRMIN